MVDLLIDVSAATRAYDDWMRGLLGNRFDEQDLKLKHRKMSGEDVFPFLRATYYRWAQWFPILCEDLRGAHAVPSVGDAHAENFGTWRDADGRPVWGANDLDEADVLPYTNDLTRLATSLRLAPQRLTERARPRDLAAAVLRGYRQSLKRSGPPTVLSEGGGEVATILVDQTDKTDAFWRTLAKRSRGQPRVTPEARVCELVRASSPLGAEVQFEYRRRRGVGLGSLGRARVKAEGEWAGAPLVREIKARVPAATRWAASLPGSKRRSAEAGGGDDGTAISTILGCLRRAPDPTVRYDARWFVRRLAPDAVKIETTLLEDVGNWIRLATAMGQELASVHLAGDRPKRLADVLLEDLRRRPTDWLNEAAKRMAEQTADDHQRWRRRK